MPSETTVATTGKMAEPSIPDVNEPGGDVDRPTVAAAARATRKTVAEKPAGTGKSPRTRSERKTGTAKRPTPKGSVRSSTPDSADAGADRISAPVDPGDDPPSSGSVKSEPAPAASRKSARTSVAKGSTRQSKSAGAGTPAKAAPESGKASTARTSKQTADKPAARVRAGGKSGPSKSAGKSRTSKKAPPAAPAPVVPPELPDGYVPNGDEEYMGPMQAEYFRRKLIDWRQALLDESEQTLETMRDQQREVSDEAERASRETEMSFELRTRDRYRKLIRKINEALNRIEEGSYGFCEETGDPIGLGRLEARPIATLSVEAQERREMLERQYRP